MAITRNAGSTSSSPHQHTVGPAAEVAGRRADDGGERCRDEPDQHADDQRLLQPAHRLREHVAADLRGAEPVLGRRRLEERGEVLVAVAPPGDRLVARRAQEGRDEQQRQHEQGGHRGPVAPQPAQHQLAAAADDDVRSGGRLTG
jgi:hypothetical protein